MQPESLLSNLYQAARELLVHYKIEFFVALILVVIAFLRKTLIDLSGWFVAIRVHGVWDTTIQPDDGKAEEEAHETARLHQFFNKVWGRTECREHPEKSFKVRGQIVGEKLSMVYRGTEGFHCGAILLQIMNLKLMKGYEVGRNREDGEIFYKTYTWHRRD